MFLEGFGGIFGAKPCVHQEIRMSLPFCLDGQIHDAQLVNRMGNWFVVAMFSHPRVEVES